MKLQRNSFILGWLLRQGWDGEGIVIFFWWWGGVSILIKQTGIWSIIFFFFFGFISRGISVFHVTLIHILIDKFSKSPRARSIIFCTGEPSVRSADGVKEVRLMHWVTQLLRANFCQMEDLHKKMELSGICTFQNISYVWIRHSKYIYEDICLLPTGAKHKQHPLTRSRSMWN